MAEKCFEDRDPFTCPICLDALQDPVTIPCGHNYCMGCVKDYWDQNGGKDVGYSCPQCRKTFSPRPVLNKNTMFAEVVERFKNTNLQDSPTTYYDGPGDMEKEICTATKPRTCPEGKDSCCKSHLRYRNNDHAREKHTVIVVSGEPKGNICSQHNRPLEDQQFICPMCLHEVHQGHKVFSVAPEKTKTLKRRTTLVKRELRSKDKTTGHGRRASNKRVHGPEHRHGHRSGHTRGSHLKRGHETHKHRGNSHGHSHGAGHRRKRLGIMVMSETGVRRTAPDNIRAL
ncbi:E3 ubiquitin-protein ligase TRIM8 [Pseudorasbora parva]|uniref:E3 ubiquitin-protein ligase TRIM8 n=1 Tax=Pseudorasbora parva TaxID=51549 RepID=UPI00351EAF23